MTFKNLLERSAAGSDHNYRRMGLCDSNPPLVIQNNDDKQMKNMDPKAINLVKMADIFIMETKERIELV